MGPLKPETLKKTLHCYVCALKATRVVVLPSSIVVCKECARSYRLQPAQESEPAPLLDVPPVTLPWDPFTTDDL